VQGRLLGGCIEVLEFMKGTPLFPTLSEFEDTIIFFETSEENIEPKYLRWWLMNYGAMGVLDKIKGIIFGKPQDEVYYEEHKHEIKAVLTMYGRSDLPVLYNASFGHCEPKCCIPYGALAELDCDNLRFSILESGVV
jgi:muramoyltetrapeptide carboxypeptidase LdcA involved in peptidoglycan recycling